MLSGQPLIRVALLLTSLLLASCATPSSQNSARGQAGITSERPDNQTGAEPAHTNPYTPSLKPSIVSEMARRLSSVVRDSVFQASLTLCPRMIISNAPVAGHDRRILRYRPMVEVDGLKIAVAPVEAGCLSSGFGFRNGKPHKGIDLFHADPVKIFAAANGIVREMQYRPDYGNMLVIEHGDGLFARYAHLERFFPNLQIGDTVRLGQTIGFMGKTASYHIARHLHYEVLTGNYHTAKGSFGLTPVDLFAKLP